MGTPKTRLWQRDDYYQLRYDAMDRDAWRCTYCGQRAPDVILTLDWEFGSDETALSPGDVRTICTACKHGKDLSIIQASGKLQAMHAYLSDNGPSTVYRIANHLHISHAWVWKLLRNASFARVGEHGRRALYGLTDQPLQAKNKLLDRIIEYLATADASTPTHISQHLKVDRANINKLLLHSGAFDALPEHGPQGQVYYTVNQQTLSQFIAGIRHG